MKYILYFLTLVLFQSNLMSQELPEQIEDKLAYDFSHILSPSEMDALQKKLITFRDSSQHKMVMVIVNDLQGYTIEQYANKLFNTWKIGKKDFNNGVLLLISVGDRKVRFEVGYGLEAAFTDIESKRIIEEQIIPRFKENKWYAGIDAGLDAAIELILQSKNAPVIVKEDKEKESSYSKTFFGGDDFSFIWTGLILLIYQLVFGVKLAKNKAAFKEYAKYWGLGIAGYTIITWLIDAVIIAFLPDKNGMEFWDVMGPYLFLRPFIAVIYSLLILIPAALLVGIVMGIFFGDSGGTSYSSSSYSDYSDSSSSSKSYSDYSDYSDSYSDYSDYSDSGGSSGGGGSSGSW